MIHTDGTWSDVTQLSDGRVILAYSTRAGELVFKFPDGRTYLRHGYSKWLLHLRAAGSTNGHIIAVGQDHDTGEACFSVDAGSLSRLGPCPGVSPVECVASGDGWDVYVLRPDRYDIYHVNQFGTHELIGSRPVQTSQGFLQCDGGLVQLSDNFRESVSGLSYPTTDGGYALGQNAGPDPARLRVYHEGRLASVFTGYAQRPRVLVEGGILYGTAWAEGGTWFDQIPVSAIPWGNDTVVPDEPFVVDPHGVIFNTWEHVVGKSGITADDTLFIPKNTEGAAGLPVGEWWKRHQDRGYISHQFDNTRVPGDKGWYLEGSTPPFWIPLNGKTGDTVVWTGELVDVVTGRHPWRHEIKLEVLSFGTCFGKRAYFRTTFDPRPFPGQSQRPGGYERFYFGKEGGWLRWEYWKTIDGVDTMVQSAQGPTGDEPSSLRFHPSPRPIRPQQPEPVDMTDTEAIRRVSFPVPSHIAQGALNVFRENLLDRDKIEPDLMTGGAFRYFFQNYCPAMAEQQFRGDIPGSDEVWGHYSWQAVQRAIAVYNRDQRPTPPPPPGVHPNPLTGPVSTDGNLFFQGD